MEIIQDSGKLNALVTLIARSSRKLDAVIHQALVSLLVHIQKHGDTTMLTKLFASLPKGSRLKSYFVWCEKFAPVKVNRTKDAFGQVTVKKGRADEDFNILEAMTVAPWDLESHKRDPMIFDFAGLIRHVANEAKKSIAAGKLNIDQVRALSDRVAADLVA